MGEPQHSHTRFRVTPPWIPSSSDGLSDPSDDPDPKDRSVVDTLSSIENGIVTRLAVGLTIERSLIRSG